jgi:hypothetical protein
VRGKIAIERAILSDKSISAEMEEVLGDAEKQAVLHHFSNKKQLPQAQKTKSNHDISSKQPPAEQIELETEAKTKEEEVEKLNEGLETQGTVEDVEMEEPAPSLASTEASRSHSARSDRVTPPSILRPPRKMSSAGRGGNLSLSQDEGTIHAVRPQKPRVDKPMTLKKGITRPHIQKYTLQFKTNKPRSNDDEQQATQATLQKVLETVLQADPKVIIPPYLDLDRNDKNIVDISSAFSVASVDSFHTLKKYFFQMSSRNAKGPSWCSIILALSMSFPQLIEKVRYSLENQAFSVWPKVLDNETVTDVGWLLYST